MSKKALVLSGGGAKGMSFIGVFRAIEKLNLHFDIIGGTSAGGIMAGFYEAGFNSNEIEKSVKILFKKNRSVKDIDWRKIVKSIFFANDKHITGLLKGEIAQKFYREKLARNKIKTLGDMPKGFFCTAVDLESGHERVFSGKDKNVPAYLALCASSAIPGVLPPVHINGKWYVDGGIKSNYPLLSAIKQGATEILMVAITYPFGHKNIVQKGLIDIMLRSLDIAIHDQMESDIDRAKTLIGDKNVKVITIELQNSGILDFSKTDSLIKIGEEQFLKKYAKLLKEKKTPSKDSKKRKLKVL